MYGMGKLKVKSIGCFLSIFSLSKVVAKELLGNVAPTYMWGGVAKHSHLCTPIYWLPIKNSSSFLLSSIRVSHWKINLFWTVSLGFCGNCSLFLFTKCSSFSQAIKKEVVMIYNK